MRELLQEIAPHLGALMAVLAAILTWKLAEWKKQKDMKEAEKMPAVLQMAAFAGEHAPRLVADAITDSIKCICEKLDEFHECTRDDEKKMKVWRGEMLESVQQIASAMGAIARASKSREEREGGLHG